MDKSIGDSSVSIVNNNPKVTVLMPVYNGEKYLREAIDSILNQTFTDFEFLIINDGSTDASVDIINSYDDPRIRLLHNKQNLKLIATLNKGLALANGTYIARMDCDDISLPTRLEKQVEFMDENEHIGLCGTWIQFMGERNGVIGKYPNLNQELKVRILFSNCFAHPSVIIRKNFFDIYNLKYDENYLHVEDYALWIKCCQFFAVANIEEVLLRYRMGHESVSKIYSMEQKNNLKTILKNNFRSLGIKNDAILNILIGDKRADKKLLYAVKSELEKIIDCNKKYDKDILKISIAECCDRVCYRAIPKAGLYAVYLFQKHIFGRSRKLKFVDYIELITRLLTRK